jgi:hypothetical protein
MTTKTPELKPNGERSGIDMRVVKLGLASLVGILAVVSMGVWWLYQYFRTVDERRDVRRSLVEAAPPVPPEPRLQVDPRAEFQEYLLEQRRILSTYGWISREQGTVRIPIDRAMELISERERR